MHARSPRRSFTSLLITLMLSTGLILSPQLTAPPATAAQSTLGAGIEVPLPGYGTTWLGAFQLPDGVQGTMSWCIQMWVPPGVGAEPATVSVHDDPALAWMIEAFVDPGDALDQAAIAYTVHQRAEVPGVVAGGDVTAAKQLLAESTPPEIRARADEMLAVAQSQSGPYADPVVTVDAEDLRYGVVHDLGVRAASGAWVRDAETTVEVLEANATGDLVPSDRAVIDTNGNRLADPGETAVWTGRTSDGPLTLRYTATGIGEIVVRARFTGLRTASLAYYGMAGNRQDNLSLLTAGGTTELSGISPAVRVAHGFEVTGTSHVEEKVIDPGEQVCDQLDLRAADGHTWLSADSAPVNVPLIAALWQVGIRPISASSTAPDRATLLQQVPVTATGPGTYRACADVAALAGIEPGMVTWQWRTDRTAMPEAQQALLLADWSDDIGIAEETSSRRHTPDVVTSLSVRATSGGLRLVDDLWADGYPDDHGDFTGGAGFGPDARDESTELWFFPEGAAVTDDALSGQDVTLIGTVRRDPVNGYQSLSGPQLAWPSTGEDLDADGVPDPLPGTVAARTIFAGDDRTRDFTTSVTDPTEQFTVTTVEPEAEPLAITTVIQADGELSAGADLALSDATDVTGTVPDDGMILTNELYSWTGSTPVCSPETLVADGDPITVTGPGRYLSQVVDVVAEPGMSYGYVETARNPSGQVVHRGECGAQSETVSIPAPPEVSTTAHADSEQPTVGDELWDTIRWSGDFPDGTTTTADLYFVPTGQELTCTPDTLVWTSPAITIDRSPGTGETDRFRTASDGMCGFVEITRGPDGEELSRGECGEPSETLTVTARPTGAIPPFLARTGITVTAIGVVGALLLVAGVLAMRSSRRCGARHMRRPRLA